MEIGGLIEPQRRPNMTGEPQIQTQFLNQNEGEISDADLTIVSGGDKAATKTTTKPTEPFLKVTLVEVFISS
jgi:hypothetical protein